jgi:hypothetical protein
MLIKEINIRKQKSAESEKQEEEQPKASRYNIDDIVCGDERQAPFLLQQIAGKGKKHQQPQPTMAAPHYRKVELQSPADFTYLYANTVALSRRKLDLYFPPSATDNDTPDPMRERVRELVDDVRPEQPVPRTCLQTLTSNST